MKETISLRQLLVDFLKLPADTAPNALKQECLSTWDSLAMVQLITELQSSFGIQFGVDEIEHLRSYDEICAALLRKGVIPEQRNEA